MLCVFSAQKTFGNAMHIVTQVLNTCQIFQDLKFCQMSKKINKFNLPIKIEKIDGKNELIFLLIWQNFRFRNICQVFHTGKIHKM